ncbi:6-phosphogluconolactonase [Thermomonas sp.]|uniref:6-phosphogluconolactonase n=1 Tax=Thermomonas sp. TaxID=1971895 RepID=UPI0035B389D5
MPWIEHDHADVGALVAHVTEVFVDACREAIHARGQAWLALAGGRTPLPVYAQLSAAGLGGVVSAIPTDERCVPHDHPACNLRALREAFAADANIVGNPLTREDGDVDASLAQARALLAVNPQPFDAVLLGMGADGHFASLFPGAANLAEGLATESGIDALATLPDPLPPEAPFARISLTLPRLLYAKQIHLVVTGADKRAVLRHAQAHPDSAFPVAALLHAPGHHVHIHWSP